MSSTATDGLQKTYPRLSLETFTDFLPEFRNALAERGVVSKIKVTKADAPGETEEHYLEFDASVTESISSGSMKEDISEIDLEDDEEDEAALLPEQLPGRLALATVPYVLTVSYSPITLLPTLHFRPDKSPLSTLRQQIVTLPPEETWILSLHPVTGVANWYGIHGCRVDEVLEAMKPAVMGSTSGEGIARRYFWAWLGGLGITVSV